MHERNKHKQVYRFGPDGYVIAYSCVVDYGSLGELKNDVEGKAK